MAFSEIELKRCEKALAQFLAGAHRFIFVISSISHTASLTIAWKSLRFALIGKIRH